VSKLKLFTQQQVVCYLEQKAAEDNKSASFAAKAAVRRGMSG